jgi:ribose/xylose/arabinose/galactoside ABC-type transport system permease subunit
MNSSIAKHSDYKYYLELFSKFGIYVAFVVIVIIFSLVNPKFLTVDNIINIFRQGSFNAIIAMGMTLVIITGGIDLSVGSVLALSAIVSCSFVVSSHQKVPVFLAVLIGLGIGMACGLFNGFFIRKGKLAPFIVTMVMMAAARGLTQVYTTGRPITGLAEGFRFLGAGLDQARTTYLRGGRERTCCCGIRN